MEVMEGDSIVHTPTHHPHLIPLTKKNDPCTSICRLHSHQKFAGSKLQYLAIQTELEIREKKTE